MVTKKSMWKVEFGAGGRTKVETAFFTDGRDALSAAGRKKKPW